MRANDRVLLLLLSSFLYSSPSFFSPHILHIIILSKLSSSSLTTIQDQFTVLVIMESCVPPGFRFHPTDEELVGYYLNKKVSSQKIDLDVIRDIDLYRIEPWDLQERCRIGYEEQSEWYFFSHKDKKYPTGTRTNRATMAGFWKATGRDKAVYDKGKLIGMRKTLVFYKGRAPNGQKSEWIMHEYRLESHEDGPPQEEGWVVCRAFKKRAATSSSQNKAIEGWELQSGHFYDDPSDDMIMSVLNPNDFRTSQNYFAENNYLCKQEIEAADNLNNKLPHLESPSLPLIKRPSSMSLVSDNNNTEEYLGHEKVTADWRDLDKFVASQLSHDEDGTNCSSFGPIQASDMALSELFNLGSDCDNVGIYIFDK